MSASLRRSAGSALAGAGVILAALLVPQPATAEAAPSLRAEVRAAVRQDTSPPLRVLARRNAAADAYERAKSRPDQAPAPARLLPKAANATAPTGKARGSARVQAQAPAGTMPDFASNFEGTANSWDVYPPDTVGDVGGDYYVQMVNLGYQVFDKNTGDSLLGPLDSNTLWDGLGGACETQNDGDPIVLYDHLADRWMLSQFALFAADGNHQCLAVSQTGDPTGAFFRYDFLISDSVINDYPHFGVWPDAYYMSINQFDQDSFDFAGAGAVAFERDQMLQGQPARMVYFSLFDVNPAFGGQLPADLDGFAPPADAPGLFFEADDDAFGFPTDQLAAWEFDVDWTNPAASTFGNAGNPNWTLETAPFDTNLCGFARGCVPQPDTGVGLDTISDRLMHRVQYRNFGDHQSLVLNHTVDADGTDHAGVRWYELRSTDGGGVWDVEQQGTYAPDAENRWMGSAAMDVSGNIALGYSVASETTYPSIRVAGRLAGDPAGELSQGENELIAGTGSQTGDASRWGDYSAMSVDPTDECTFFYTTEYMETTGDVNWQTRVGSFKFPNCSAGPSGTVSGTVTDADSGDPIARAKVGVGGSSATTDAQGAYSVRVPVGVYDVTASAFGYDPQTVTGVQVDEGDELVQDFALEQLPVVTLSGTVTDDGGHGWPLWAKVELPGTPLAPVFTSPTTGEFEFTVPAGSTYTLAAAAQYPGYLPVTEDVTVGPGDATQDLAVPVDTQTCVAPGYAINSSGTTEGFDGAALPAGWSVDDTLGNGQVWAFDDPGDRGNLTGGEGPFAVIDSDFFGDDTEQDSSLVSPAYDLSDVSTPAVSFAQDYNNLGDTGDVDVSLDGGTTWETVLHQTDDARGPRTETIPLPQAANQPDVRVRFHYYDAAFAWWWEVDDVFVGSRSCDPLDGGLVVGHTRDANGAVPLNGVTVTSVDEPADAGVSAPTPQDPNLDDGFYWLFSSLTGDRTFEATKAKYESATADTTVPADGVVRLDFTLEAGRVTVTPTELTRTMRLGASVTGRVTYKNVGTATAHVVLSEQDGSFVIRRPDGTQVTIEDLLAEPGAPLKTKSGTYLPTRTQKGNSGAGKTKHRQYAAEPWQSIADFPTDTMDNAMAYLDGKAYSFGGFDGDANTAAGFAYDPTALAWSPVADLPEALEKPSAAAVGGRIYVFGGWLDSGDASTATYVYDPASDSWSQGGDMIAGVAAPGVTVSDGKIFSWGGCQDACGLADGQVYDPGTDTWSAVADYPEDTSWQACGEIGGSIYCAGGTAGDTTSTATYAYDVAGDAWSQVADLPIDLWGMGYTGADGLLLVSGGVTDGFDTLTNAGYAYDPGADSWSPIPNTNDALYRGGSTCGFYRVGGSIGGFNPTATSVVLPGFDVCGAPGDVSWLSESPQEFDLAPGRSVRVVVTMDSSQVAQPGTYTARIKAQTDTPYAVPPVAVTMKVNPPRTWGKLRGTVRGASCAGQVAALPGATVQVNGRGYAQTLISGTDGTYAVWLSARIRNLAMIVAKDGYVPQTRPTGVRALETTTENYLLEHVGCRR